MSKHSRKLDLSQCRVALIVNAKAGKEDTDDRVAAIRRRIEPAASEFVIVSIPEDGDIAQAARTAVGEGADVVAVLGGDGTQSAVAGALADSGAVMAVLPGGTFNYLARELGLDTMDKALDALVAGVVRTRDLGSINDRIFVNNTAFGLYPRILARREAIYRDWGRSRLAAYWSMLSSLRELNDPMHLSVRADGAARDFRTPLAFVAASAFQLENFGLEGARAVRNGSFALIVARHQSRLGLVVAAWRLARGKVARGEDFDLVTADEMLIETRAARRLVAIDGEKERMTGPFQLKVLRDALRVIVPDPASREQGDAITF